MTWLHHWWVNIGLNNDLVSSGNKPLLWQMFSKICVSLSRSQRVNIFTDSSWADWFLSRSLHGIQLNFQKTKIFGSTSIIHLSDVTISDRYLIKVDPGSLSLGLFALATPGGACLAAMFCWSCRETVCKARARLRCCECHTRVTVTQTNTPGAILTLGQLHHDINSYKGRHKQRNRSKRFPIHCIPPSQAD